MCKIGVLLFTNRGTVMKIKVLIADNYTSSIQELSARLEDAKNISVVAETDKLAHCLS
jgi:hypothetical protein